MQQEYITSFLEQTLNQYAQHNPLLDFSTLCMCVMCFLTVLMSDDDLILHRLHFITVHFNPYF